MTTNILLGDYQRFGEHTASVFMVEVSPAGEMTEEKGSNRIGWPITARICLQMVLCYSSSSYARVFVIFYVYNSQLHAWNPLFFFPALGLSFIFSLQLQFNLPPSLLGSLLPWKCRQYIHPQQWNPPTRLLITKYKTTTWIFTLKKLKIS